MRTPLATVLSVYFTSEQNLWNNQPNSIIIHSITTLYKYPNVNIYSVS